MKAVNLKMLELVASKLGNLCDEVVFLGGSTTAIFITDPFTPDVRTTFDVDCIIDVISQSEYYQLAKKLREKGFEQSHEDDLICRWHYDEVILDVMPTDEKILGFSNKWYKQAIQHAFVYKLTEKLNIKVVTAPYFLATKLEAFRTRGNMDFMASHDFEDIISVLDGRPEIVHEIDIADEDLKDYLRITFKEYINDRSFLDSLEGHFTPYGDLINDRVSLLKTNINTIIKLN